MSDERRPLSKTQRMRRARSVRFELSRFVDLHSPSLREHVRERGYDPDEAQMARLMRAKRELDSLIDDLRAEAMSDGRR
jgi:hypothetical protein